MSLVRRLFDLACLEPFLVELFQLVEILLQFEEAVPVGVVGCARASCMPKRVFINMQVTGLSCETGTHQNHLCPDWQDDGQPHNLPIVASMYSFVCAAIGLSARRRYQ